MESIPSSPITDVAGILFRQPARDLGEVDRRCAGIASPGYSDSELALHVHDVFLKDADAYLRQSPLNQASIDHFADMIRDALGASEVTKVLDIGSGAGTTAFAAAQLYPDAHVIATDLAVPLLLELRNFKEAHGISNVSVFQMNAEDLLIADQQVDAVLGAFVLHHALSLETIFAEVFRVLRPGGKAVFWEAIESGAQILARVFEYWDDMNQYQTDKIPDDVIWGLRIYLADLNRRVGRSKSIELLQTLDDKWFFTKAHLRDLAGAAGFRECTLRNVYAGMEHPLKTMASHEIDRRGFSWKQIPAWAQNKLLDVEAKCSSDFWNDTPFTCVVTLRT